MIGADQAREPEQAQLILTGGFEFAGGANPMEVPVEPDLQQQAGRVGRTAFGGGRHRETEGGQLELIDELTQKAGGMIGGHPVFKRRGKQKLLAVFGSNGLTHRETV